MDIFDLQAHARAFDMRNRSLAVEPARLYLPEDGWDAASGECDTCGARYDVGSRIDRCGDCGECEDHCAHLPVVG